MKKVPAIILLTLGNLAAVCIVYILVAYLSLLTYSLGIASVAGFAILAALGLGFASGKIAAQFKKKYALKPSRFFLAAHVPSAAISFINFIIICILNGLDYFDGFCGTVEFLSSLIFSAVAVLYLIFGVGFTLSPTEEKANTKG